MRSLSPPISLQAHCLPKLLCMTFCQHVGLHISPLSTIKNTLRYLLTTLNFFFVICDRLACTSSFVLYELSNGSCKHNCSYLAPWLSKFMLLCLKLFFSSFFNVYNLWWSMHLTCDHGWHVGFESKWVSCIFFLVLFIFLYNLMCKLISFLSHTSHFLSMFFCF